MKQPSPLRNIYRMKHSNTPQLQHSTAAFFHPRVVLAALFALVTLGGGYEAHATDSSADSCVPAPDNDWCPQWIQSARVGSNLTLPKAAISPDGSQIFITGYDSSAPEVMLTIAVSARTGETLWTAEVNYGAA